MLGTRKPDPPLRLAHASPLDMTSLERGGQGLEPPTPAAIEAGTRTLRAPIRNCYTPAKPRKCWLADAQKNHHPLPGQDGRCYVSVGRVFRPFPQPAQIPPTAIVHRLEGWYVWIFHGPRRQRPAGGDGSEMSFLQLEQILGHLAGGPQDVLAAQDRLRTLLRKSSVTAAESSMLVVLRHIVTTARDLADARYAALALVGGDGLLDRFVHVGMAAEAAEWIGALPQGRGVLGLPISGPEPVRLTDLSAHPCAVGFPPNHPKMRTFLGVPVWARDQLFGSLYLAESAQGEFTADDEQVVTALAATAGVVVDCLRLSQRGEPQPAAARPHDG